MIVIRLNQPQFEYDILSLVKAFYKKSEVKIMQADACILFLQEHMVSVQEEEDIAMEIHYGTDEIAVRLFDHCLVLKQEKVPVHTCKRECTFPITGEEQRIEIKNQLKKAIYQLLGQETGRQLPWGTLTGIRPTKIPMAMVETGKSDQEIVAHMEDTYYMSREKAELCIEIARLESRILSHIHHKEGYSLYIGIPFCPTTCLYCSFTSYPRTRYEQQIQDYIEALIKELTYVQELCKDKILDTIYIGGGTPTTLTAEELEQLLHCITSLFSMDTVQEFTVEAGRADTITREKLEVLKKYGVGRISINPQTMKEETLSIIGRNHTIQQVKDAFSLGREVGFSNINMDMILGLPEETMEDVVHTMEAIKELDPDSITVHSLAIKRASGLSQWMEDHGVKELQNPKECMEVTHEVAKSMGMKPYYLYRQKNMAGNMENVGYARDGKYGIYNIIIMEEKQNIVAVGAGSISKVITKDGTMKRCDCVKDVQMYIDEIEAMIQRKRQLFELVK